ncbi:hypothetical protein [Micromonospora sp. NPDC005171]|uniref:hypothetical protein n=1 Tax=Micromonospora sp. NPDC005171 TaxID=3156866 RepID=UPI0033A6A2ED
MTTLKPGDLLMIDEACSVQFARDRPLRLRLVSVDPRPTYHGWVWLTSYVLNDKGLAIDKREVFVQQAGIRALRAAPAPGASAARAAPAPRPRLGASARGTAPPPDKSPAPVRATPVRATPVRAAPDSSRGRSPPVSAAVPRIGVRKRPGGYLGGDTAWVPPFSSATTHSSGGV